MDQHLLEDYVKHIYKLTQDGTRASTTALATALGLPLASVSKGLPRLASLGLVQYDPYRGAVLTENGRLVALEVIRHHRLLEVFLHRALGMAWDEVHGEAERLEHVLSDALEARMDAALGYPTTDPHGDPIPAADLTIRYSSLPSLAEAAPGDRLLVRRVRDDQPDVLRYLEGRSVVPGARVTVESVSAMEGIVHLLVNGGPEMLSLKVAEAVFVEPTDEETAGSIATLEMNKRTEHAG